MLHIMKKLRLLPLLTFLLLCLCSAAFAANIPGQQNIADITDATGSVSALTDDDASTAWIRPGSYGADLTINLYGASVGEIWMRNGYAYTQNWYNHYDRPAQVKVTLYYRVNQYTTSYDTYRYQLKDLYQPNAYSASWNGGYQRLLLPKQYRGVTKIELTIESTLSGYGNAGTAIADIIVASGSHATATPRTYATATPKPYVVYVTPTPGPESDKPLVELLTPVPEDNDDNPWVELITPPVTATPRPEVEVIRPGTTPTPYVELLTPVPKPTDIPTPTPTSKPVDYPTEGGVIATLSQRAATRSGPGTGFDEPGSFYNAGDEVKVLTKAWDDNNNIWWYQIEFIYRDEWYRAYTTEARVDVDPAIVATEPSEPLDTVYAIGKHKAHFGPGDEYRVFGVSVVPEGGKCAIYCIENGWAQVEYYDYGTDARRRGWVPLSILYDN